MLSAIVLTKNEQDRIKVCLESIKWVDEIIILDNGSTDQTLEIARKYTNKIYKFENKDYASFRNKGLEKTDADWILYIDPDERVPVSLKEELQKLIKESDCSAYAISRKNIIFGQEVKYGPFWPDWVIRLFRKEDFETWIGKIHEYPKFRGKLGYTSNSLLHLTHRDVDQIVYKSLEWSKIDAELRLDSKHPKMSTWRFIRILGSELFNQGILRKGFFNGSVGTVDSILQAFSMFITYVRLWQLQRPKSLEVVYKDIDKKIMEDEFNF